MYKFEISAETPAELREMQIQFAKEILDSQKQGEPLEDYIPGETDDSILPLADHVQTVNEAPHKIVTGTTVSLSGPVDARGLPWDARIHSDTKTTITDGSWRNRRGVSKELVKQVEQELLQRIKKGEISNEPVFQAEIAVPVPPPPTAPVNVVVPPMPVFEAPTVVAPVVQQTPVVSSYDNVPVPTGSRPAHNVGTFKNNLMLIIAQLINEGKIDQAWVEATKQYFGVKEIWNIIGSEKQSIELFQTFVKYGFITEVQ